jgi:ADP-ribose pyrophosphatase YjhB (NUDIX family)
MFKFCPSCASINIRFEQQKFFHCNECGFVYYHNTAAAVGCIIDNGGKILFLTRAEDPQKNKLDIPGGFVDPEEGIFDALLRECHEELRWRPDISSVCLYASFPNKYPYKNIVYNTCDMFFYTCARGITEKEFYFQKEEISDITFIEYDKINLDDLAFESTKKAVGMYLTMKSKNKR